MKREDDKNLTMIPDDNKLEELTESARKRNERKLTKKRTRFISLVQKNVGLNVTQVPANWLIVWGFGLANGTTKTDIKEMFKNPEEIRFYKDKAYSIMRYATTDMALNVKELYEEEFFKLALRDKNPVKRFIGFINDEPPPEDLQLIASFSNSCPSGLRIIAEFVTKEEEELILSRICPSQKESDHENKSETKPETITKILKHRWVRHFGYEFRYGSNDIDLENPLDDKIPSYLDSVIEKMVQNEFVFKEPPQQLTVNQYQSGQGIPPHVDTHSCFEGPIVSLSLGSEIVMNFRRGDELFSTIVPCRSLLVMDGDVRHGWTHGIANRTFDLVPNAGIDVMHRKTRTSFTFRRLRKNPICCCSFPEMCDSQQGKISEENASNLEDHLVHKVYENIAPHFHETRHTPWPRVRNFIESITEEGAAILDVGCGNGKYFHLNSKAIQIGTDMSTGLLKICRDRNSQVLRANALQLPFRDECFHAVICIAVLHHVSTKERRLLALAEIMRILTAHGQALIYVWSKDQRHQDEESVYAKQSASSTKSLVDPCDAKSTEFSFIHIHERQTDFSQNDVLVPWVNVKDDKNPVHHRYYHVFDKGELEDLVSLLDPPPQILDSYYDQGNWVVKIMKNKIS